MGERTAPRKQLPGSGFKDNGSTTLLQLIESGGKSPMSSTVNEPVGSGLTVSEVEANALKNAIPANKVESVIRASVEQPQVTATSKKVLPKKEVTPKPPQEVRRGMIMIHVPSKRKVTVIKADVSISGSGDIKHKVIDHVERKTWVVLERNLKRLN